MYSYRTEQAIRAAAVLHQDQVRKGAMPLPYITHLVAVAFTLWDYTDDEDVIIAALLHDTLEDTDYTAEELREDFGDRVSEFVESITEPKFNGNEKLPWRARKEAYIEQLKNASAEALMVASADKIHNFRSIIEEYYDNPQLYIQDFGQSLDERLEIYQTIHDTIVGRLGSPIVEELSHVFEEYKQFLYKIKNIDEKEI